MILLKKCATFYVVFLTLVSQLFMLSIRNVEAQTDYKMKTLRFIGMAVVAIIMSVNFVACSDDDDDNPIVGTWRSEVSNNSYDSFTFNTDGSGIWQEYRNNNQIDSDTFKYSIDGDKITFTWADGEIYTSTFSISDSRLTIKDGEDSETYTKQ